MSEAIPINALFGMDFVTLLVMVESSDTMAEVCEKVAANVIGKRIKKRDAQMGVYYQDQLVPSEFTVKQAGILPLQFVFVDYLDD